MPTESTAPLSAAGVWLAECWVSPDSHRWLALTGSGTNALIWGIPVGKPSSYLGETQEITEGLTGLPQ